MPAPRRVAFRERGSTYGQVQENEDDDVLSGTFTTRRTQPSTRLADGRAWMPLKLTIAVVLAAVPGTRQDVDVLFLVHLPVLEHGARPR